MTDNVSIEIDGKRFRFWEKVRIQKSFDTMHTVGFSGPFDEPTMSKTFEPMSFKSLDVVVDDEFLFSGTLVNVSSSLAPQGVLITCGGYSLPGVLGDVSHSLDAPSEFKNMDLKQIVNEVIEAYGIGVVFEGEVGPQFKKVQVSEGGNVLGFIVDLAKQRNLITSSTPGGELLFRKENTSINPVAKFDQGLPPMISLVPTLSPQAFYSHVTGIKKIRPRSKKTTSFTVKNPFLNGVYRPYKYEVSDTEVADVETAVRATAGRMFAGAASYVLTVPTWRDPLGALWQENTHVRVRAPGAMVFNRHDFLIRDVVFEKSPTNKIAMLTLVMPGAFNGEIPERVPWSLI